MNAVRVTVALVALSVTAFASNGATAGAQPAAASARPAVRRVVGAAPRSALAQAATPSRRADPNAEIALNLGLAVRHSAELDDVIVAASTPGSAEFGNYLTPAQYAARYAPTASAVATVRSFAVGHGMRVTGVSGDNLIVSVDATTAAVERAFGVTMHNYGEGNDTFAANDVAPTAPADSGVHWVTGLDGSVQIRSFAAASVPSGGYRPIDFRTAYNTGALTTTESIGFTLWGAPLQQSDLAHFAADTSTAPFTIGPGADAVEFIPCSASTCVGVTPSTDEHAWDETALDVESAHGIARGSHMKYWLGNTDGLGHASFTGLENAVNAAANDSTLHVVSNSWGVGVDGNDPNMDASLQHAASVGTTFFFSSGDTADISYPATSPYVVAVGGTTLNHGTGTHYFESAWSGSGTGCSHRFGRPSWQIGVTNAATCSGRAEPDVAADAAPSTGAYVFYGGTPGQVGGTSLAAPLWAGMTALWNQANVTAVRPRVGFLTPKLYALGNNTSVYSNVFHDVTTGSAGGHPAGPKWDEVTGWGSPNLANLIAADQFLTHTTTTISPSDNPSPIGNTVVYTATVTPAPTGGSVTFRQAGKAISGCTGRGLSSGGHATCSVIYGQSGTYEVQVSFTGNSVYAGGASGFFSERVDPQPAPPAGYWMTGSGGAVYAFGAAAWHGNANTANVSHFEPTPSRHGYWIVNRAGQVFAFGDARSHGNAAGLAAGETVSSLSSTKSGNGYWLFTSKGRALTFGDAHSYGDLSGRILNRPVIGSVATPSGRGYYMVASDGGIFSFGDAGFFGSTGNLRLNKPVNGLVPTPTNRGYWMVASDGGIFAFGDASFRGSMGGRSLNKPVVGMVRYGNGYLMVGSDGGIFDFSDKPFLGSLAGRPLAHPIVSVAS